MDTPGYIVFPNLSYTGQNRLRQQLDVYLPREAPGPVPLVVIIHGGGWQYGDKGAIGAEAWFLDRGYGVARINYRFSTEAVHPAQLEDCRAAIRFLKRHSAELGIDPARMTAIGHSAGGHLVSLVACTAFEAPGTELRAAVNQAGPTDFPELAIYRKRGPSDDPNGGPLSLLETLLGHRVEENPENTRLASPTAWVSAQHRPCPHLLIYGDEDPVVPISQGELFHEVLTRHGADSTLHVLPQAGHVDPRFWQAETFEVIHQFFQRCLKSRV